MKKIIILLIRGYQIFPSYSHKMCRFIPTCSEYMIESIDKYGVIKGIKLGLKRLKKCRPNGPCGYDPVP
ncbi:MAG: membrane protein insertion efficiency factor YidD [bacterium]|nr:membrane protein insertion efficiency factor YidD [bacterium]